jgi:hypothetical protein
VSGWTAFFSSVSFFLFCTYTFYYFNISGNPSCSFKKKHWWDEEKVNCYHDRCSIKHQGLVMTVRYWFRETSSVLDRMFYQDQEIDFLSQIGGFSLQVLVLDNYFYDLFEHRSLNLTYPDLFRSICTSKGWGTSWFGQGWLYRSLSSRSRC